MVPYLKAAEQQLLGCYRYGKVIQGYFNALNDTVGNFTPEQLAEMYYSIKKWKNRVGAVYIAPDRYWVMRGVFEEWPGDMMPGMKLSKFPMQPEYEKWRSA